MAKKATAAAMAPAEEANANAANANKRQTKALVSYSTDGNLENAMNSPTEDCRYIHVEFADKTTRTIQPNDFPESVRACAMLQGIVTRFQRGYQTLKEVDKVVESFDETIEDLSNGVWVEFATGEPKVTQLAKAVVMALEAKGESVDEARRSSIIEKLKNSEYAKKAKENPAVMAHLSQLQLEAAQRRAEERQKAAASAGEVSLGDF